MSLPTIDPFSFTSTFLKVVIQNIGEIAHCRKMAIFSRNWPNLRKMPVRPSQLYTNIGRFRGDTKMVCEDFLYSHFSILRPYELSNFVQHCWNRKVKKKSKFQKSQHKSFCITLKSTHMNKFGSIDSLGSQIWPHYVKICQFLHQDFPYILYDDLHKNYDEKKSFDNWAINYPILEFWKEET